MKSLRVLQLWGTAVTTRGRRTLRTALVDTRVA
jgi:hypothetical protein